MNVRGAAKYLFLLILFVAITLPAQAYIKLYLKDGSYQLVKSYQIEGNRVRYYSVDRSQWEEVPVSLVDFTATQRAETQTQQSKQKILLDAKRVNKDTYQLPVNTGYLIAPGVRLPDGEGVYAYAGLRVVALLSSEASLARDRKRMALNMALPGPILKSRSLVVLPGPAAGVRLLNRNPAFYIKLAGGAGSEIELLRVKARKNDRVVEAVESRLSAQGTESRTSIPVERTQPAPGVIKLQPRSPLPPGEYALGEVKDGKLNLSVWDFGIDGMKAKSH